MSHREVEIMGKKMIVKDILRTRANVCDPNADEVEQDATVTYPVTDNLSIEEIRSIYG